MTTPAERYPLAALRRAVARGVAERRMPPYVVEYVGGRARVAAAAARKRIEPMLLAPGRAFAERRLRVLLNAGPDRRLVRAGGEWQVAVPFEHESIASLVSEHRRRVNSVLRDAGINAGASGNTVMVAPADRSAALVALAVDATRSSDPLYVASGRAADLLASPAGATRAGLARVEECDIYRNYWLSDSVVVGKDEACRISFGGKWPAASLASASTEHELAIDVVYTWVDDTDPEWARSYGEVLHTRHPWPTHALAANASRYRNRGELRYSLRSLALHAPWVRRIFIVTCGHVPPWLATADERIHVVRHDEILDGDCLPTFNSHAIETALHRIPGLAEHYLYCNDDFFFGRPVGASLFFLRDGTPRCFPDCGAPIPDGPATDRDAPVDAAAKNVRDLIGARFGGRPAVKMRHAPYPQRKSLLVEIEREFTGEVARTAASRFRSVDDVSVASCLSHHYGLATGRAVIGSLPAAYVNVADRWAPIRMERLLARRDCDVFCLNETEVPAKRERRVERAVAGFLAGYFPRCGPFEVRIPPSGAA